MNSPAAKAVRLEKSENKDLPVIGRWNIDPVRSLITISDVNYRKNIKNGEPKLILKIEKVIADYLYYRNSKDELNYSVKVDGLVLVYELSETKEKKKKFSWFDLNLPIDNIFKELLFTELEAVFIKNKKTVPVFFERLMINKLTVFPKEDSKIKYADFDLEGFVFDGKIKANGRANPFTSPLPLNLNLRIQNLSLDNLNPWLKESASLKMKKGTVDVFVEFATKNGKLEGYVKFFTKDAELMNEWKDNTSFFNNLKKSALNFGLNLMERTEKDIISGKIKFEGKVDSIDIEYSSLLQTLVDHFFDGPLKRKYDKTIALKNL